MGSIQRLLYTVFDFSSSPIANADPGQNGHTPKRPHPKRPQNFLLPKQPQPKRPNCIWSKRPQREDHYQNGHTAFGQNGRTGRTTTKTATIKLLQHLLHRTLWHQNTFTLVENRTHFIIHSFTGSNVIVAVLVDTQTHFGIYLFTISHVLVRTFGSHFCSCHRFRFNTVIN